MNETKKFQAKFIKYDFGESIIIKWYLCSSGEVWGKDLFP